MPPAPHTAGYAPRKVLVLGPRRAGKSSLIKVVYESFQPNDTLFLDSTTRLQHVQVKPFQELEIWDTPGSSLLQFGPGVGAGSAGGHSRTASGSGSGHTPMEPGNSPFGFAWTEVSAIVFVIDAQDDYYEALVKLHHMILTAYAEHPGIHFHVFINKVDGLSDDYKYDTQRDIEQRVYNELVDASHEFRTASGAHVQLDEVVNLRFHFTSVFDSTVYVAFSRVQQGLMESDGKKTIESEADNSESPSTRLISLHDAVESACNALCSSCHLEKAYIFDVPSRTFVGCDSSPFDLALFDVMSEYILFSTAFTDLYAGVHNVYPAQCTPEAEQPIAHKPKRSQSVIRMGSDTSLAFWQLNRYVRRLPCAADHTATSRCSPCCAPACTPSTWVSLYVPHRPPRPTATDPPRTGLQYGHLSRHGVQAPVARAASLVDVHHVTTFAPAAVALAKCASCDTMSTAEEAAPGEAGAPAPAVDHFPAREVQYCPICTFPYEYCEFGPSSSKCRSNLEATNAELYAKLYSEEAISDKLKALSTEQAESLERESAKRERKTAAKAEKERAQLAASKIVLSRVARTKRKVITVVHGLHLFSPPLPPLKVVAKGCVLTMRGGCGADPQAEHPVRYGRLGVAERAAPGHRRDPDPGRRGGRCARAADQPQQAVRADAVGGRGRRHSVQRRGGREEQVGEVCTMTLCWARRSGRLLALHVERVVFCADFGEARAERAPRRRRRRARGSHVP